MHALEAQIFYLLGFIPASPGVVLPWVITAFLGIACYFFTRRISLIPIGPQNVLEWLVEELSQFFESLLGHKHAKELIPIFSTIFIYILTSNLLGIIPGLKSPTSIFSNCLGMALIVFIMTQYLGFKHQGLGYLKHFWGEPVWLGPLMFPIHVIGELARPVSLTLRLFGNIMGEDVVILVLTLHTIPLFIPIPMLCMAIFTSVLQTLVFTILSSIYVSGAINHDH